MQQKYSHLIIMLIQENVFNAHKFIILCQVDGAYFLFRFFYFTLLQYSNRLALTSFLRFTFVKHVAVTSFNAILLLNKLFNLIQISIIYSSCERAQRAEHFGTNISKILILALTSFFQITAVLLSIITATYEACDISWPSDLKANCIELEYQKIQILE